MRISIFLLMIISFTPLNKVPAQNVHRTDKPKEPVNEIQRDSLAFLPKGTIIHKRTKDKIYCFLIQDTDIQGVLCRGDKRRGWETVFYSNGQLAQAWPAKTQKIQGIPCMKASFWTEVFGGGAAVYFHRNGKLAQCTIAADTTISGKHFEKGDHLYFDAGGKLLPEK